MISCMRPSRALDNPAVLIACSLLSNSSIWRCWSLAAHAFLPFKHRQYIAGRVFKPRDLRTSAAENPLFVCHQVALIVGLEMHTTAGQLVYRLLNVGDRKIQNGECGRNMILLGIHQDGRPAGDMKLY